MRIALARVAEQRRGALPLAQRLLHARRQRLDHRVFSAGLAQAGDLRVRLARAARPQQRAGEAVASRGLARVAAVAHHVIEVGHGIARLPLVRAQLGAHQLEFRAVEVLPVGQRGRPVLGVGDALDGHRVRPQVAWHRAVVGNAARALHLFEERRHGVRVEAGLLKARHAEPVGLALEIARVGELRLHRARLRGHRRAGSKVGTRAAEQDRRGKRDQHRHLHLLLLAEHARDVPLRDVRDLVRQDRGELGFGVGDGDQSGMHADEAAGHGEGVDRGVTDGEELEVLPRPRRRLDEAAAERRQVLVHLRIVDVRRVVEADVAHHGLAEAPLHLRRQRRVAGAAEVRERLAKATRRGGHEGSRHQAGEARGDAHMFMIAPDMAAKRRTSSTPHLTHFDARGSAHMVDVGSKPATVRVAIASGRIVMRPATFRLVAAGRAKKGDVLGIARVAAIQAAKRTPELIPLAHPIALTRVAVSFQLAREEIQRRADRPRRMSRPDRRGDGGADRRRGRPAHRLRHGEGGRPRHDAQPTAAGGETRREIGDVSPLEYGR